MKHLVFLSVFFLSFQVVAQTPDTTCNQLPIANPKVKAICEVKDLPAYFSAVVSSNQKKGTYAAVYKLQVTCSGKTQQVVYQRGTFTEADQKVFASKIGELHWTPAVHENAAVTSMMFISFEIVNGKITVVVQ